MVMSILCLTKRVKYQLSIHVQPQLISFLLITDQQYEFFIHSLSWYLTHGSVILCIHGVPNGLLLALYSSSCTQPLSIFLLFP